MSRLPTWIGQHLAAVRAIIVMTIITGAIYPLAMLGVAQAAFHNQANGSLVPSTASVVGSSLLCQEFVDAKGNPLVQYFQPRPSTASSSTDKTDYGCDPQCTRARPTSARTTPRCWQNIKARQGRVREAERCAACRCAAGRGYHVGLRPRPVHLTAERRRPGQPGRRGRHLPVPLRFRRSSASTPRAARSASSVSPGSTCSCSISRWTRCPGSTSNSPARYRGLSGPETTECPQALTRLGAFG